MSNPNVVNLNNLDTRYATTANINSAVAAQAATDAGQYTQKWKANTAYVANQIVVAPDGSVVSAIANFTSGASYSASNWTTLTPTASTIASTYATSSSVTSAITTQSTTNATTYLAPDVIAPAATGVAATDTTNILNAISATPANGWLHVRTGRYYLNQSIVISKNMRLTGAGVFPVLNTASLPDNPHQTPFLNGTVFVQTASATDAIQISGDLRVDLADFGIMFDTAIAFTNTGHGINATPPVVSGQTYHQTGLVTSLWKNITIFGHDGNHYARLLVNSMHNTMEHIRSHGGGILKILADHPSVNYGNHVELHPFGSFFSGGSADAYHLEGPSSGSSVLNLITIVRPQANVSSMQSNGNYPNSPTPPTASQSIWKDVGNVRDVKVEAPDLENDLSGVVCPITFGANTYVDSAGGYLLPVPAYVERKRKKAATQPTITILSGGGTSTASFSDGNADDDSGVISFAVPASAGLGGGDLFTVTFTNVRQVAPKFVHVWIHFATSNTTELFVASASSTTGFTVRGFPAPPNSGNWQIAYKVEP